jgi:hypothetical protein
MPIDVEKAAPSANARGAGAPEADIPPDLLRRGVEIVETWETINTDESATDLVNRLFRLFSSTVTQD